MEPLTVVEVDDATVTMSTGEVLIARYEKLRTLCQQLQQEGCPIWIRVWLARDGVELVEAHRISEMSCSMPSVIGTDEVF